MQGREYHKQIKETEESQNRKGTHRSVEVSWLDGSAAKGTCHQVYQPEFYPRD